MDIIKLKPYIKSTIWGGNKLKEYGKHSDLANIAESWELSFHQEGKSIIDSGENKGKCLADVVTSKDLGINYSNFKFFPTLIKLINADDNLSVQVHPSDEYALKNENSFGKTEMWYILEAEKGSGIYLGFKKDVTEKEVRKHIKNNNLQEILNFIEVKPGDCYFVPSGTVHAIGKGITLFEVQQNSNLTYRIYDWGRVDKNGKGRELHIEKAIKVINMKKYVKTNFDSPLLGKCAYFSTYEYDTLKNNEFKANNNSFTSITFIDGKGMINNLSYSKGDTFFIPAGKPIKIQGNGKYLLTNIG